MTVQTLIISSGADDCYNANGGTIDSGAVWAGNNGTVLTGGMRWLGVAVPQGALITSATLALRTWHNVGGSGTTWGKWFGDSVDNAPAWSGSSRPDQIIRTAAFCTVQWTASNDVLMNHDVTAIIQEIVNRTGWASGNAIRIAADGVGDGGASFRELTSLAYAIPLVISFVSPAGGGSTGRGDFMNTAMVRRRGAAVGGMTSLLIPRSRNDARARVWLNWLLDRLIYRGAKGRAQSYLGVKSEAQVYLGERDLF